MIQMSSFMSDDRAERARSLRSAHLLKRKRARNLRDRTDHSVAIQRRPDAPQSE
jgi:hypothetical protein